MKKSKKLKTSDVLYIVTDGLIGATTNLILYSLFLSASMFGKSTTYGIYQGFRETDELMEEINYQTIKRTIYNLTAKGLLTRKQSKDHSRLSITKQGRQQIRILIPHYKKNRIWDGNLYLVSYDVPTSANIVRNRLRRFLRRIGCGLLQESLWITPYNPKRLIGGFVREYQIEGTILISELGKDGAIGDEDLNSLINRVYKLDKLSARYGEFINRFSISENVFSLLTVSLAYHAILKNDPQLPFELLPKNFLGTKAYHLYRSFQHPKS